ncbi:MAG: hypothetical protein ABIW58_03760 [Sphingomicrobium sp.]
MLIISKCYDTRALLAAKILSDRGARVGVDLFDDYFSQRADSRLSRYRMWLGQMLTICDFAMCSTLAMAKVIESYRPGLAVHVLNDPAPDLDNERLFAVMSEKLAAAQAANLVRLAWFGVGDNPYFPVGLSDVAAFSDSISRLQRSGIAVELTLLTNVRSLDARGLSMVSTLPVSARVAEWTEAGESELLSECFACFLPVNAQGFSAAKSLNRAMTALAAGCQVISVGYPLYAALDAFIYREIGSFIDDLRQGRMRLGTDTISEFEAAVAAVGSSASEAAKFAEFLRELPDYSAEMGAAASSLYLVHGFATNGATHKMVQAVGGLSVKTPFCHDALSFDVIFETRFGGEVAMLVSDKALALLLPGVKSQATQFGKIGERNFWKVGDNASDFQAQKAPPVPSLPLLLSLYPSVMQTVVRRLEASFGPGSAILSETSPLPFEIPSL